MLLTNIIVLASSMCFARGYVVPVTPGNAAPGFQTYPGASTLESLDMRERALSVRAAPAIANVLDIRVDQDVHCLCGTTVEETSYKDAEAAMVADLGTGKYSTDGSGNFRHTMVKGDTVAFVCILSNPGNANMQITYGVPAGASDFGFDSGRIRRACGAYVAGSIARYDGSFTNHYGFFQTSNPNPDPVALCTSPDLFVSAGQC